MRFALLSMNEYTYEYPSDNFTCGMESMGNALVAVGWKGYYESVGKAYSDVGTLIDQCLDLVIVTIRSSLTIKLVEALVGTSTFVVVYADGVAGLLECLPPEAQEHYIASVLGADLVLNTSPAQQRYLKAWAEHTRFIGTPVDIDNIEKQYNRDLQEPLTIWHGFYYGSPSLNTIVGLKVAGNLGYSSLVTLPAVDNTVVMQARNTFERIGCRNIKVDQATTPLGSVEQYLSRSTLAMHMNVHPSLGRLAAECAVVGIPCIGGCNGFQELLFPKYTIVYPDTDSISNVIEEAQRDLDAGDQGGLELEYARREVEKYRYERWAETFLGLVGERL